jgi:hypothetical protein
VSLFDCQLALLENAIMRYTTTGARLPDTPALRRQDTALLAGDDTAPNRLAVTLRRLADELRNGRALDVRKSF